MVCTELALRRHQFHVAPAMQQPKSSISTPLPRILKIHAKKGVTHSESQDVWAVSLLESRGKCCIIAMNNKNNTCLIPQDRQTDRQGLCTCGSSSARSCWSVCVFSNSCITSLQSWLNCNTKQRQTGHRTWDCSNVCSEVELLCCSSLSLQEATKFTKSDKI